MKDKFSWAIPLSEEEVNAIFESAIITFDTNVLLDLYRIDENARNELKKSIEFFKDKVWIPHQVAHEFIKNKNEVCDSAIHIFSKYISAINRIPSKIDEPLNECKSKNRTDNRIILEQIDNLTQKILQSVNEAVQNMERFQSTCREEIIESDILSWVFEIFDGKVGAPFASDRLSELRKEAEKRIADKIPPGYADNDKKGIARFGDFFLWKQILEKAKAGDKHIIFVTREKKEDWFEILSQRKAVPRYELMQEAHEISGKKILIYRTEYFIEKASRLQSDGVLTPSAEKAIEEIKNLRLRKERVVTRTHQSVKESSEVMQSGVVTVNLSEPLYKFTVSGALRPHMVFPPQMFAAIIDSPEDTPEDFSTKYGTGTTFDFNIHFKSNDYGVPFPEGNYTIRYVARCPGGGSIESIEGSEN